MSLSNGAFSERLQSGDPALLNRMAWSARWTDRAKSRQYASRVLEIAEGCQHKRSRIARGLAFRTLSWQAKWRGNFDEALQLGLRAEAEITEKEQPIARADVYSILGVVHYSRSRLDLASCAVDRGFTILSDTPTPENTETFIDLLTTRATIQRYNGLHARAGITLSEASRLAEKLELARVEHNIARFLVADGDYQAALKHAENALVLAKAHNNRVVMPYTHEVAGACLVKLGRPAAAIEHFAEGARIAREDEDQRAQCQILREHGNLEMDFGDPRKAVELYTSGAAISAGMGYSLWQKNFSLALARAHEELGELKQALEHHKHAWKIVETERN